MYIALGTTDPYLSRSANMHHTSSFQGPYFYQVYASKTFGSSSSAVVTWVSRLFLTGFASTALFGPLVGRLCDSYGRKAGTLAFSLLYSLGAISTKSNILGVLLLGRVMGGIGTSLLFSAPEAWLVGEAGKEGVESSLGETFGLVSFVFKCLMIVLSMLLSMPLSEPHTIYTQSTSRHMLEIQ